MRPAAQVTRGTLQLWAPHIAAARARCHSTRCRRRRLRQTGQSARRRHPAGATAVRRGPHGTDAE